MNLQVAQWGENVAWYNSLIDMPNPYSILGHGLMLTAVRKQLCFG
jgi:hypothetical protein